MSSELTSGNKVNQMTYELAGSFSANDLHQVINQLGESVQIKRFEIELTPNENTQLSLPGVERQGQEEIEEDLSKQPTTTDEAPDIEPQLEEPETEPASAETSEAEPEQAESPGEQSTQMPRLQAGGDPYQIMQLLIEQEGWLRTKELRESIPDEWDVSKDTIGTSLWNLEDRGLVEKRPYEEDKRQTEYRATDAGREVVERTQARLKEKE